MLRWCWLCKKFMLHQHQLLMQELFPFLDVCKLPSCVHADESRRMRARKAGSEDDRESEQTMHTFCSAQILLVVNIEHPSNRIPSLFARSLVSLSMTWQHKRTSEEKRVETFQRKNQGAITKNSRCFLLFSLSSFARNPRRKERNESWMWSKLKDSLEVSSIHSLDLLLRRTHSYPLSHCW